MVQLEHGFLCVTGYNYSGSALVAIFLSAVLGLLVSLSTFLVIGATSSLTYNVIGHVKVSLLTQGTGLLCLNHRTETDSFHCDDSHTCNRGVRMSI